MRRKHLSGVRPTALLLAMILFSVLFPVHTSFAEETVHIVFWHSMSENAGESLNALIDDFNAGPGKEMGIEAEAVFQGKYSDATAKMNNILTAGRDGDLPDVMNLDATGKVNYFYSGKAYTADRAAAEDPLFDLSAYPENALANWQFAGEQLGVPFAVSTTLTFYNASLLEQAPDTFADLAALAETLGEVTVFSAVPETPSLANWLGQMGSDIVDHRNGTEADATRLVCVENGALTAFLSEWKALYASGALENATGSLDDLVAGTLAVTTASSSKITSLLSRIDGRFELGVGPYLRVNDSAAAGATVSGSCLVMFDTGDPARMAASRELIRYLTGAEAQARFCADTGYIPVCAEALSTEPYRSLLEEHPQYRVAIDQLVVTPSSMCSVTVGPSVDFYYAIQNGIMDMLEEDLSPEETTALLSEELQELLDRYHRTNQ